MKSSCHPRIVIIGAGFSGTSIAMQLHRLATMPVEIYLIEAHNPFGTGFAYATAHPALRLNGPASFLSAFEHLPEDFVDWLKREPHAQPMLKTGLPVGGQFVPRSLYGDYLLHILTQVRSPSRGGAVLRLVRARVVTIDDTGEELVVSLQGGECFRADCAVLATGHYAPKDFCPQLTEPHYIGDSRDWRWTTRIAASDSILFIGTGQTMIDCLSVLSANGHKGPMFAVSRRGLIAHPHATVTIPYDLRTEQFPSNLNELVKHIRDEVCRFSENGGDWRAVMAAFLPATQFLWMSLPVRDKKRFFEHLEPYWYIHRTRLPPDIAAMVDGLRSSGRLKVFAGRLISAKQAGQLVHTLLKQRTSCNTFDLEVNVVVNCTGPNLDLANSQDPFMCSLLQKGLIQPHPAGVGIMISDSGAVVNAIGSVSSRLFALGLLCKGALLESIVIREIRKQSEQLAKLLLDSCAHRSIGSDPSHARDA